MPNIWSAHLRAEKTSLTQEFIDFVRTMMQKYSVSAYYVTMVCLKTISTRKEFSLLTKEDPNPIEFKPAQPSGGGYHASLD